MQADLVSCFYLLDVFIGRTFHWLQFLLQLQCFATMDISLLLEEFDRLGQLVFLFVELGTGLLPLV